MPPVLEVKSLGKVYPNGTRALDDVSFSVNRGELVVIVGPSGAGKSTLLRTLNRLIAPTSGEMCVAGRDMTHAGGRRLRRLRRDVGMIFQQFNLSGRLTVIQNVMVGQIAAMPAHRQLAAFARLFGKQDKLRALECLRVVGIEQLALQRADTLSGGQQQRVAIARVLAQQPKVILADEPIASLDPRSAEVVMSTLRGIGRQHGVPVLINLHQLDISRRYATRIIAMRDGRVVYDGPPERFDDVAARLTYGDTDPNEPGADEQPQGDTDSRPHGELAARQQQARLEAMATGA